MNIIKLNVVLSALLLSACAGTEVKQEEAKKASADTEMKQEQAKAAPASKEMKKEMVAKAAPGMSDAELKTLLVGKTMYGVINGNKWTTALNPGGKAVMHYKGKFDTNAVYTLKNGMYCRTRENNGNNSCWTVSKAGEGYNLKAVSGTTRSFAFKIKPSSSVEAKTAPNLNDAQLKALLVGKTIVSSYKGDIWTTPVGTDGTFANISGGKVKNRGAYTIKDNMYCRTRGDNGDTSCWTVQKRANDYYATLVSGSSLSYEFTVKS